MTLRHLATAAAFVLFLAPATASSESVSAALDLTAKGKIKKAGKVVAEDAAGDPMAAMLAELFEAYRSNRNTLALSHLRKAERLSKEVEPERLEAALDRVRALHADGGDFALRQLTCHLRTLHPSPSADFRPEGPELSEDEPDKVRAPRRKFSFVPPFPAALGDTGPGGEVIVRFEIDTEGCTVAIEPVESFTPVATDPVLDVTRWFVFEPATLDGVPVDVYYNYTTTFSKGEPLPGA